MHMFANTAHIGPGSSWRRQCASVAVAAADDDDHWDAETAAAVVEVDEWR